MGFGLGVLATVALVAMVVATFSDLQELRLRLHSLVGGEPKSVDDEAALLKLKMLIDANLRMNFKRNVE